MTRTVKIGKHGANAGWWILRDALAADLPFTNSGGSFHGEPVSYVPSRGQLAADLYGYLQADQSTYVIFSYATPIAWRVRPTRLKLAATRIFQPLMLS